MPISDPSIVQEWYKAHPDEAGEMSWKIFLWTDLADRTDYAYDILFDLEDWLSSDRTTPPPDIVQAVAWYGYIRLRLQTWELPIKLTNEEKIRWREAGYFVELSDFQEAVASIAGGFFKLAGTEPNLIVAIMKEQLAAKLAELDRLASLSLDDVYTPRSSEADIRERLIKEGHTGEDLEELVDLELLDDDHKQIEVPRFEKPFALRQQLQSFEWGMEKFRILVLTERDADLGLPNQELFGALMQINLNNLLAQLHEVDTKLRRIWRHLAKYNCYCLNASYEPEQFWWRHMKRQGPHKGSRKK